MKRFKQALCLILPMSFLALALPAASPAATDMFLELEGIKGESRDQVHKDDIDVLAWSWGVSNSGPSAARGGGGDGAGKANLQDLSLTKWVDAASVPLLTHAASGHRIPSAELTVRKAGEKPLEYLKFCLTDVGVSSISSGGSGGEDRLTENVSLSFGSIVMTYVTQGPDGRPGNPFVGGWDLVRGLSLDKSVCDSR